MEEALFDNFWKSKCNTNTTHNIMVNVTLSHVPQDGNVYYIAAAPPDLRTTFTGSGLPFISLEQGFENTPNTGIIHANGSNVIQVPLVFPNMVYQNSVICIPPTLFLKYMYNGKYVYIKMKISNVAYPYRDVRYGKKHITECEIVKSQEQYLRDTSYPNLCFVK